MRIPQQSGALGLTQGFVTCFPESSTGWLAIPQLLCSQAKNKLHEELLKRNKRNLNVRPSAPLCRSGSFSRNLIQDFWETPLREWDKNCIQFHFPPSLYEKEKPSRRDRAPFKSLRICRVLWCNISKACSQGILCTSNQCCQIQKILKAKTGSIFRQI